MYFHPFYCNCLILCLLSSTKKICVYDSVFEAPITPLNYFHVQSSIFLTHLLMHYILEA